MRCILLLALVLVPFAIAQGGLGNSGVTIPLALPPSAMNSKLTEAYSILLDHTMSQIEPLATEAVQEVVEALFLGNRLILTTFGVNATQAVYNDWAFATQASIQVLEAHINFTIFGTPETKSAAIDARDFLLLVQEAVAGINAETSACDPQNIDTTIFACALLAQPDESGTTIDTVIGGSSDPSVGTPNANFVREIRSPFPWWSSEIANLVQPTDRAESFVFPIPSSNDFSSCAGSVKEIRGIKVLLRPRIITVWTDPWAARQVLINVGNTIVVWTLEFLPAEFFKVISVCSQGEGDHAKFNNAQEFVVVDRQLSHFWHFVEEACSAEL